jgi:hypothetical protein
MPEMTAAAHPISIGGKEYQMSPLTERDLDELDAWYRKTMIDAARSALSSDMTQDERDEVMDAAVRQAHGLRFLTRGAKMSGERFARLIWQGCKKKHPQLTMTEVITALKESPTPKEDVLAIFAVWEEINGANKNGQPPAPKQEG